VNESLDRQLARLRTRLAKTPLPGFFAWWGSNLLACLPPRLRAIVGARSDNLLVQVEGEELLVWREHGDGTANEYGRISLSLAADAQAAAFQRLRAAVEDPAARTVYCMPSDRVLQRTLNLPAAAEDNLRQVLAFEMDRQTPFKADQVYFDSRVLGRDATGRSLRVDLVVIPRAQLDAELARVAGADLALAAVDSWTSESGGSRRRTNLLPPERRARNRDMRLPLNLGLAALAIVLLAVNMAESLSNRAAAKAAMEAEVEAAKVEARKVAEQKNQLTELIDGANFLTEKKRKEPLMIALLDDITRRLPDDAYLERLSENDGQVQMQGEADEAAKLIGLLVDSPYLSNPGFQGQVQPDPRTGKDRFTINADLNSDVPLIPEAASTAPAAAAPAEAAAPSAKAPAAATNADAEKDAAEPIDGKTKPDSGKDTKTEASAPAAGAAEKPVDRKPADGKPVEGKPAEGKSVAPAGGATKPAPAAKPATTQPPKAAKPGGEARDAR
jgi:general secretion pathway protein L